MTTTATPTTAETAAAAQSRWRVVDVVVASALAVAFGVVFWAWGLLWNSVQPAFTGFPPLQGFMYGVWLMPGVLGALVIRKPGAALFRTETTMPCGDHHSSRRTPVPWDLHPLQSLCRDWAAGCALHCEGSAGTQPHQSINEEHTWAHPVLKIACTVPCGMRNVSCTARRVRVAVQP